MGGGHFSNGSPLTHDVDTLLVPPLVDCKFRMELSLGRVFDATRSRSLATHALVKAGNSSWRCALLCVASRASIIYAPHAHRLFTWVSATCTHACTCTYARLCTRRPADSLTKALVECRESCLKGPSGTYTCMQTSAGRRLAVRRSLPQQRGETPLPSLLFPDRDPSDWESLRQAQRGSMRKAEWRFNRK